MNDPAHGNDRTAINNQDSADRRGAGVFMPLCRTDHPPRVLRPLRPLGATNPSPKHHDAVIVCRGGALYAAVHMDKAKTSRLTRKRTPLISETLGEGDDGTWSAFVPPRRGVLRRIRVIRRLLLILSWTVPCFAIQALLILLPGGAARWFQRVYWSGMCGILGLGIRTIGAPAQRTAEGRPVVYVSTHSSWLDVLVLGARLDASFIAKEEIAKWPVVSWIARLGRTVYVRRVRASTARERDEMRARLAAGDSLILFPEGTTSDGSRVMPFRSAFLSIAELPVSPDGRTAIVQPISLVYDRLGGLPIGRATRGIFAWYGDMDLASHFWRIGQERGLRASMTLHTPLDPATFASRKALTEAVWHIAADGAATLRQNRPAEPLTAPAPIDAVVFA